VDWAPVSPYVVLVKFSRKSSQQQRYLKEETGYVKKFSATKSPNIRLVRFAAFGRGFLLDALLGVEVLVTSLTGATESNVGAIRRYFKV